MKLNDFTLTQVITADIVEGETVIAMAEELLVARHLIRRLESLIVSTNDGSAIDITSRDARDIFDYLKEFDGGEDDPTAA